METADEMARLREEETRARAKIDERLLSAYSRIRSNVRNGLAVVTVKRDACGGCFNRIPPQRQFEIRQNKKIIVCEYCGRILVSDELVDRPRDSRKTRTGAPQCRVLRFSFRPLPLPASCSSGQRTSAIPRQPETGKPCRTKSRTRRRNGPKRHKSAAPTDKLALIYYFCKAITATWANRKTTTRYAPASATC